MEIQLRLRNRAVVLFLGAVVVAMWTTHEGPAIDIHQKAKACFVGISGKTVSVADDAVSPEPFFSCPDCSNLVGIVRLGWNDTKVLNFEGSPTRYPLPMSEDNIGRTILRFVGKLNSKIKNYLIAKDPKNFSG